MNKESMKYSDNRYGPLSIDDLYAICRLLNPILGKASVGCLLYHAGKIYGEKMGEELFDDSDPFLILHRCLSKLDKGITVKVIEEHRLGSTLLLVETPFRGPGEEECRSPYAQVCCFLRGILESYIGHQQRLRKLREGKVVIQIDEYCTYRLEL